MTMKKTLKLDTAWKNSLSNNTKSILSCIYAATEIFKKCEDLFKEQNSRSPQAAFKIQVTTEKVLAQT